MKMRNKFSTLLLITLSVTFISCGGGSSSGSGGEEPQAEEDPTEDGIVTFAELRQNILAPRCIRCHSVFNQEGFVRDRVVPGDADNSLLFQLVETGTMPQGGPRLTESELEVVRTYIDGLALNVEDVAETEIEEDHFE